MNVTNKSKIFVNGRFLTQKITGINRFACELCNALTDLGIEIIIVAPKKIQPGYSINSRVESFGWLKGPLWEQIDLPLYLLFHRNQLLLSFSGLGPLLYKNKVTTIHDLAFLVNPSWYSKSYYWFYRFATPLMAKYSKKIITVSAFSKNEIIREMGIPAEKIEVIYNAVHMMPRVEFPPVASRIDGKYIFSVSSIDPRKNINRLIEAYKRSGLETDYKLILAGKSGKVFNMQVSSEIVQYSLGYVSEDELQALYQNASLFVYPSLYEGFGIPPLEAMACGCPTVISDIPVFKEIFGNAACYVDPGNADDIKNGMIRVLTDRAYRDSLMISGFEQVKKYNWKRSANLVFQLIQPFIEVE